MRPQAFTPTRHNVAAFVITLIAIAVVGCGFRKLVTTRVAMKSLHATNGWASRDTLPSNPTLDDVYRDVVLKGQFAS